MSATRRFFEDVREVSDNTSWLAKLGLIIGGVTVVTTGVCLYYLQEYLRLHNISKYRELEYPEKVENKRLRVRVVNLDGALPLQKKVIAKYGAEVLDMLKLGPSLRMDCWFNQFSAFETEMTRLTGSEFDEVKPGEPLITFYGSNDFHHLTLGLFRRMRTKVNLIMFDNHPDYIQYYPTGLHCGCWLSHAASLPSVNRCWHLAGYSGEFEDTTLTWCTPWSMMRDKKMMYSSKFAAMLKKNSSIHPAQQNFTGMKWEQVEQTPLRKNKWLLVTEQRIRNLFAPYKDEFAKYPLYITLDKDCMQARDALQNWNSGVLLREEVAIIIKVLIEMSNGRLYAMDITGDFTPVKIKGVYRHFLHMTQHSHSENQIDPKRATFVNELTNRYLLREISKALGIAQMQDALP